MLYVIDSARLSDSKLVKAEVQALSYSGKMLLILNKSDLTNTTLSDASIKEMGFPTLICSAMEGYNIKELKAKMSEMVIQEEITDGSILTNQRHYDALVKTGEAISAVEAGLDNQLSGDLLAIHIKDALYQIGLITGEISTDDLLENIFSSFCIGK